MATLQNHDKAHEMNRFITIYKQIPLSAKVFIGLLLGILVGVAFPDFAIELRPISDGFLRLIKMLIAPLIFSTLVIGIAGAGGPKHIGRLGAKTLIYFEVVTTLALVVGLFVANTLQPGANMDFSIGQSAMHGSTANSDLQHIQEDASKLASARTPAEMITHLIPTSVVDAMARGDILQLVVFAVFFALALAAAGDKGRPIFQACESLAEVMFKLVGYVMAFAPLGVFAAIAANIGKNGLAVLGVYWNLVVAVYVALAIFVFVILMSACLIARIPFFKLLKTIREPFLLAFSTASSESAMPQAMAAMERFGVPKGIVSFVMPTGYSFNLDGSTLYLSLATLFVAQMAHIAMPLEQQLLIMFSLMLTSKGVAGVPRVSLVVLSGTLTAFGLPLEGIALILGIDHLLDMGRTSINLMGNCVATAVVARWENQLDDEKMSKCDDSPPPQSSDDSNSTSMACSRLVLEP